VIAVNDAYLVAPFADICYFADSEWWGWHSRGIAKPKLGLTAEQVRERFAAFAGEKCSIQNSGANVEDPSVHLLRNKNFPAHGSGISLDPECLMSGGNSGWQAINLAVLAGAKTVLLLGYDAREPASGRDSHWFGEHPKRAPADAYAKYRQACKAGAPSLKAADVRVINCSPGSAIDAFERLDLAQALRL